VGSSLSKRPKRLFHAIVACGVTITACGSGTTTGDDGGTSDAAADAKSPKDGAVVDATFPSDAQDEPDAFDPPDVTENDVVVIKPPPPPPPIH